MEKSDSRRIFHVQNTKYSRDNKHWLVRSSPLFLFYFFWMLCAIIVADKMKQYLCYDQRQKLPISMGINQSEIISFFRKNMQSIIIETLGFIVDVYIMCIGYFISKYFR